jgi:Tfp pilus assembly protein PilV
MAVMAVGLSGLAAMLIRTVSGTALSSQQTAASWLAESLAAQLQLSPQALPALTRAGPAGRDCRSPGACTPREFALANYAAWQADVAAALPGGTGLVCLDGQPEDGQPGAPACDGAGPYIVKVLWRAPGGTGRRIRVLRP